MGLTLKTMDDMVGILEKTINEHQKLYGTALTKKETRETIDKAIAKKRKDWLEGRLSDYTIEELQILKEAVGHVKKR